MAKQEQQDQSAQGREMTRPHSQGNLATRNAGFPAGLMISPSDFFRMGPFSLMRRMSEEMERVVGEYGLNRGEGGSAVWAPRIEVSQTDNKYEVRAELPGINPADVKLEVTDDAVILEGERKTEINENMGGVQLTERQYGHFYRAIPLPEGAQVDEAKAKFDNGVLDVTVPIQAQKETRRQIPIESSGKTSETSGKAA